MKALRLVKPRIFECVAVAPSHLDGPDPVEKIIVQTQWVSLCGSDIPFFTGRKRHLAYPLAPGRPAHECLGQVVESTAALFRPGDQVLAIPELDLGLAEFYVAKASKAIHLPPLVAAADSSCLIQPLSTVMNAVDRLGDLAGRSAAVVGLGSIGLLFCWLLKQRGAQRIVGIDPLPHRCQWAEALGIDQFVPLSSQEVVHAVHQHRLEWTPPDICIEAVGHQMDTVNDCLELVRQQGTVMAFGVPDHPVYALEYEIFFRKNANLMAAVTPDWAVYLARARDLFQSHQAEFGPWVTHRFPIHEAEQAFTLYASHGAGIVKTVLDATRW